MIFPINDHCKELAKRSQGTSPLPPYYFTTFSTHFLVSTNLQFSHTNNTAGCIISIGISTYLATTTTKRLRRGRRWAGITMAYFFSVLGFLVQFNSSNILELLFRNLHFWLLGLGTCFRFWQRRRGRLYHGIIGMALAFELFLFGFSDGIAFGTGSGITFYHLSSSATGVHFLFLISNSFAQHTWYSHFEKHTHTQIAHIFLRESKVIDALSMVLWANLPYKTILYHTLGVNIRLEWMGWNDWNREKVNRRRSWYLKHSYCYSYAAWRGREANMLRSKWYGWGLGMILRWGVCLRRRKRRGRESVYYRCSTIQHNNTNLWFNATG